MAEGSERAVAMVTVMMPEGRESIEEQEVQYSEVALRGYRWLAVG